MVGLSKYVSKTFGDLINIQLGESLFRVSVPDTCSGNGKLYSLNMGF